MGRKYIYIYIFFLACLCLTCVELSGNQNTVEHPFEDVKPVLSSSLLQTRTTKQYEVQHPFWDENKYMYLACLCLGCVERGRSQYSYTV